MNRIQRMLALLLPLLALALVISQRGPCNASTAEVGVAAKAVNAFALDLYGQLRKPEGNLFFSPYSVSMALGMTYTGASGQTKSQMAKTLHVSLEQADSNMAFRVLTEELLSTGQKSSAELKIANALWAEKSYVFLKEFVESVRINYDGDLRNLDFQGSPKAAENTINKWVEEQTQDRIKDLIPPGAIGSDARLVLTNAIYFKGMWSSQFNKQWTKEAPFTVPEGKQIPVPLMQKTESFGYAEDKGLQVVEMPYKTGELSMVVLLPDKQRALEEFEQSLTLDNLGGWLSRLKKQQVHVYIPRFKMLSSLSLQSALTALGMPDAFSRTEADFSGMTGTKDLFIGAVFHKAFVEVNEEGTEAAAATAVTMPMASAKPKPHPIPVFRADHPFVFLIRHKPSNCILFLGRITKP